MRKNLLTFLCGAAWALSAHATPVLPHSIQWNSADGTCVTIIPQGDEKRCIWLTADGYRVMKNATNGEMCYAVWTMGEWNASDMTAHNAQQRTAQEWALLQQQPKGYTVSDVAEQRITRAPMRIGEVEQHVGAPNIPVILVEFADVPFTESNPLEGYERRLCRPASRQEVERGEGSAYQYFVDQSNGKFLPHFQVMGPVKLPHNRAYYGANAANGQTDPNVGRMIADALQLAIDNHLAENWSAFDNDGDGVVDAAYVIYAGEGEHAYPMNTDLVWPHASNLTDKGVTSPTVDGVTFSAYSCSNEMLYGKVDGFGVFCHEFSHCLGLPDMYRTDGVTGFFCMGPWDVMNAGQYNGNGFIPMGYRAKEKEFMGWLNLPVLDAATTVTDLRSTEMGGTAFVVKNKLNDDEQYVLETIDHNGWNAGAPGEGLMIQYFFNNPDAWKKNEMNNSNPSRVTLFAADNDLPELVTGVNDEAYNESLKDDLYPSKLGNNELTDTSTPAATVQIGLSKKMKKPITSITYNETDGIAGFLFMGGSDENVYSGISSAPAVIPSNSVLYGVDGKRVANKANGVVIDATQKKKYLK